MQTNEKITERQNSTYNRRTYRTDKWQMRPPRRQHNSHFSEATCATAIRRYVADRMSDIGAMLSRSAVPRDNDYNRNYRQNLVAVILSDNSTRCQSHSKTHTSFLALISLISPNNTPCRHPLSSDKTSNIFTAHLPLARNVRIVHYSPLCLQIEWHLSLNRETVGGIRLPQEKFYGQRASPTKIVNINQVR